MTLHQDDPLIMTHHIGPLLFVDGNACKDGGRSSLSIPWLIQPKKATLHLLCEPVAWRSNAASHPIELVMLNCYSHGFFVQT